MTRTAEQSTMRKVYLRLLPFSILCMFVCYLDRVNVGFAALTMNKDLGLSAYLFGLGFPARHRGRMISWFTVATPISVALGGPISTALLGLDGVFGLAGWKWVFLVEAAPAVILGFVLLAYLRDRPADASWLTQEEKDWIAAELARERRELEAVRRYTLFQSLTNIRVVALAVIYFGIVTASVGLVIFVPQIIKQLGVSNLQTGFLTMIPYVVGTISMVAWGYVFDRMQERKWNLFIGCLVGAAGLIIAGLLGGSFWSLAAMCLATIGFYGSKGPFWPLPSTFLTGTAAAAGMALINSVGNAAGSWDHSWSAGSKMQREISRMGSTPFPVSWCWRQS